MNQIDASALIAVLALVVMALGFVGGIIYGITLLVPRPVLEKVLTTVSVLSFVVFVLGRSF